MYLIVGLGNPGEKYQKTRHNLGFEVVDVLAHQLMVDSVWLMDKKFKSQILKINEPSTNNYSLFLVKPETYMNNSGLAVRLLADYYKIPPENIVIIHDDLDILLGKIKVRKGGSGAGHRGVESVIKSLGTDNFIRVRVGIGPTEEHMMDAEEFVVSAFTSKEKPVVKRAIKHAVQALKTLLKNGLEKAQNEYN